MNAPPKSFKLQTVKSSNVISKTFISKKKFYSLLIIAFLTTGTAFLVGNYYGQNGGLKIPFGFIDQFFEEEIELNFNVEIQIQREPLDIVVNISNVISTSEIMSSEYQIDGITSWIPFSLSEIRDYSLLYIDHDIYYEILNLENNTILIKMSNAENMTLTQLIGFYVTI